MPFILRTIRKSRWYKIEDVSWLANGDIPADPLADLYTKDNKLSVWLIENDRSNLKQVATAFAATRNHISHLDYALLDLRRLPKLNIKIKYTMGGTPNEKVNTSWHRNLVELSAFKLVELTKVIMAEAERKRIPEKEIGQLLTQAVTSGQIEQSNLNEKIRNRIDKLVTTNGARP